MELHRRAVRGYERISISMRHWRRTLTRRRRRRSYCSRLRSPYGASPTRCSRIRADIDIDAALAEDAYTPSATPLLLLSPEVSVWSFTDALFEDTSGYRYRCGIGGGRLHAVGDAAPT